MLPELQAVNYTVELPYTGKVVYRPITVKEEGIIFTAQEMGEEADLIETFKNIVRDCIVTEINVNEMLAYEFVYMLMLIRSKSKGSIISATTQCKNTKCKEKIPIKINVDELDVFQNKQVLSSVLEVTEDLTLEFTPLKAHSLSLVKAFQEDKTGKFINSVSLVAQMVNKVVFKKKVFTNFPEDELINNILSRLTIEQMEAIGDKLKELITFGVEVKYTCPKCEKESKYVFKDPVYFLE